MKPTLISICFFALPCMTSAQEIPEELREYVFYTYLSIEHVWYGDLDKVDETRARQYRLVARIDEGVRDLFVERLDYVLKGPGKVNKLPEDAKLTSFWRLNEEDFNGIDSPSDTKTPIAVEKWISFNSLILKVGSSRYLMDFRDLPLRDFKLVDEKGNVIDFPIDH